jgi:hypothetical protein
VKTNLVIFGAGVLGMVGVALLQASAQLANVAQRCLKKQGEMLHDEFTTEPESAEVH